MKIPQQQVKDWMAAFGQETPDKPVIPSDDVLKLRSRLVGEEATEIIIGLRKRNLKEILDGCCDLIFVTLGTLVACGLDGSKAWDEVCRSNWTKLWTYEEVNDAYMNCKEKKGFDREKIWWGDYNTEMNNIKDIKTRAYLVKDQDGKVIKSPSYSPPNFEGMI